MLGRDVTEAASPPATRSWRSAAETRHHRSRRRDGRRRRRRADCVINCAAFTDVDGAEPRARARQAVNGVGAGHVAAAAAAAGAWVIHVSTDYVFNGAKPAPYVESDPSTRSRPMGAPSSTASEPSPRRHPTRHTIVRTAWLFGAGGRFFPGRSCARPHSGPRADGGRRPDRGPDLHRASGARAGDAGRAGHTRCAARGRRRPVLLV